MRLVLTFIKLKFVEWKSRLSRARFRLNGHGANIGLI